jgi:hypothetical protein
MGGVAHERAPLSSQIFGTFPMFGLCATAGIAIAISNSAALDRVPFLG